VSVLPATLPVLADVDRLSGLVTPEVGRVLYDLARSVAGDYAIVEIGSYKGKSTCYLAAGARDGDAGTVFAVDPWDLQDPRGRDWYRFSDPLTRRQFHDQVNSVGLVDQIVAVRGFSTTIAAHWHRWSSAPIGLLYIDGDHSAQAVEADFRAWAPHLSLGAMIVFDDYVSAKNPGVELAVDKLENEGDIAHLGIEVGRLAVATLP
jgi:predicted O-methyltransferase YrrM